MNETELRERNLNKHDIQSYSGVERLKSTKPSPYGELPHPELLIFGIDGGADSYIVQQVAAGKLPNFARLLKRSTRLAELRTAHPTITPSCWSSIMTGATPEVNGINSDQLHLGGSLADTVTCYHGDHLHAERLWEAAARIGKTSLVSYMPVTAPARSPLVRQCGGYSGVRLTRNDQRKEFYDVPLQLWFFDLDRKPSAPLKGFIQQPSPVIPDGDGKFKLQVKLDSDPTANYRNIEPFDWEVSVDKDGFTILFDGEKIKLQPESWSKTVFRELPSAAGSLRIPFSFGCYAFEDGFLIITDVTGDLSDVCSPEIYKITREMPPPPLDKAWTFWNSPVTARIAVDSCDNQTDWHIEMTRRALHDKPSDIVVTYLPNPDTVNHFFWQVFSGCIDAADEIKKLAADTYALTYTIVDRYLGFLLDEVIGENTTILVVGDHGTLGHVADNNINKVMAKAGLLTWQDEKKQTVDWSRTRAAMRGCGHIWVNLQGRETGGIVPPEEYDDTVYAIIAALQDNLRGPDGRPYLAFAVRREEAGFFGLGGKYCGDVVYGLSAGYGAMTIHAEQIPSARSKYGSMLSLGILSGPGIAQGKNLETPVRTVDLAPTLCTLLGYPLPKEQNGHIIRCLDGK